MLYRFLFFIGVKDELIRLIKALYSGFLSSSESKKPVCKCSLLYTTRYHPIRYRKANSKCKVYKTQKNGGIYMSKSEEAMHGITFKDKIGYAMGDMGGLLTFGLVSAF